MKVLVNGGLNLSELDGWWAEAFSPEVGWSLGDSTDHSNDISWDNAEANELYEILENKIVPEFYDRNTEGIPVAWTAKIRNSMSKLTPQYSSNRSVREYTDKYYMIMSGKYQKRVANKAALTKEIVEWKLLIEQNWDNLRFGDLKLEQDIVTLEVFLGNLRPEDVKVELFANGTPPYKQAMSMIRKTGNNYLFQAKIGPDGNMALLTPRIIPFHPDVEDPLEINLIKWQK